MWHGKFWVFARQPVDFWQVFTTPLLLSLIHIQMCIRDSYSRTPTSPLHQKLLLRPNAYNEKKLRYTRHTIGTHTHTYTQTLLERNPKVATRVPGLASYKQPERTFNLKLVYKNVYALQGQWGYKEVVQFYCTFPI